MSDDYDEIDRLIDGDPIILGRLYREALAELDKIRDSWVKQDEEIRRLHRQLDRSGEHRARYLAALGE